MNHLMHPIDKNIPHNDSFRIILASLLTTKGLREKTVNGMQSHSDQIFYPGKFKEDDGLRSHPPPGSGTLASLTRITHVYMILSDYLCLKKKKRARNETVTTDKR